MCVICILWEQEKLTVREAKKALCEMVWTDQVDIDHVEEVLEKIEKEEEE